jgi:hypothetical protein
MHVQALHPHTPPLQPHSQTIKMMKTINKKQLTRPAHPHTPQETLLLLLVLRAVCRSLQQQQRGQCCMTPLLRRSVLLPRVQMQQE